MSYTILLAEDDSDITNVLTLYLESEGHRVVCAEDGREAWELFGKEKVDLALLDIMMPQTDGITLTRKIRAVSNIPIVMLTARIEDRDKLLGLNSGADDYITKPFNPLEVLARVNAQLRRYYQLGSGKKPGDSGRILRLGKLELNTVALALRKDGREIILTPNEYKLLYFLMKTPGRVYTKSQICQAMNGDGCDNYENSVMVHISHLREKIEDDPKHPVFLKNVRGVGYKIENQ